MQVREVVRGRRWRRSALLIEYRARKIEPPRPSRIEKILIAARELWEKELRARTIESARKCGKIIGGATVADPDMLTMALHYRDQGLSLRDMAAKLVPRQPPSCGCCAITTSRPRRTRARDPPLPCGWCLSWDSGAKAVCG
ncbi:hypothetical protein [Actinomadura sp. NTSP31]|uniref:hypothetical protein n=1 Tax=Actinomadura sp. NTSP31 TaxID=1735447 RepID=UPI0035C09A5B